MKSTLKPYWLFRISSLSTDNCKLFFLDSSLLTALNNKWLQIDVFFLKRAAKYFDSSVFESFTSKGSEMLIFTRKLSVLCFPLPENICQQNYSPSNIYVFHPWTWMTGSRLVWSAFYFPDSRICIYLVKNVKFNFFLTVCLCFRLLNS